MREVAADHHRGCFRMAGMTTAAPRQVG